MDRVNEIIVQILRSAGPAVSSAAGFPVGMKLTVDKIEFTAISPAAGCLSVRPIFSSGA